MRKNITMTLAVLALSTVIAVSGKPVMAETRNLAKSGAWSAYIAKTKPEGTMACGMGVYGPTQSVQIKWFEGVGAITVQVFKDGWRIPEGTNATVELGFDDTSFGSGNAVGFKAVNGMSYLAFNLEGYDLIKPFIREFKEADKMWLKFPEGNEKPWNVDMAGSRKMADVFMGCISELEKAKPTQPYGKQPETSQPFDLEKKPATPTASSATERGA